jgi:membrane protease YdiL (CAAX protease family)
MSPRLAAVAQALLAAVAAALLALGWPLPGLVGLGALVLLWPPAVPWAPLRFAAVVRSYGAVLPAWALLLVGYLWAMRQCGCPVVPQPVLRELAQHGLATEHFVGHCVLIVGLAPLAEELLFRGYLLGALRTLLPGHVANGVCAAAFGLCHGLPYALPLALLGTWFGWLRVHHGALLPALAGHALHNALTVALTVLWPAHFDWLYPA